MTSLKALAIISLSLALGQTCLGQEDIGNIWFVGDSITQSNVDGDPNGSPRKALYDKLTAANYDFTYTGHWTANIDGLPSTGNTPETNLYHYHTGISGATIGANNIGRVNMTAGISNFWNSGRLAFEKPDAVLLMLGTNDTDQFVDLQNAPARMTTLINTIHAQPGYDAALFVAQIPPNFGSTAENNNVTAFNAALVGVVDDFQAQGKDVTLVDMYSPIISGSNLMFDSLHTNRAGNDVLAQQWFDALESRFSSVPEPNSIGIIGLLSGLALLKRRRKAMD